MTPLAKLAPLLDLAELAALPADAAFQDRDVIKARIAEKLRTRDTAAWLAILQPHDVWCADVLDWPALFESENFRLLDMVQTLGRSDGFSIRTLRSPIRVDGHRGRSARPAPRIGEDSEAVRREFGL
jgi:crotonobetainyl-CoA:carnitine CoA-transferase CaiB-like acyl-CoA transferase